MKHARTRLSLLTSGLMLVLAACGGAQEELRVTEAGLVSKSSCLAISNPCSGLSREQCGNVKCGSGADDYCIFSNGMCRNPCATVAEPVPEPVPAEPTQVGALGEQLVSKSSCLAISNPCSGLSREQCGNVKCGTGADDYCIFSNGMCRNPCATVAEPLPTEPVIAEPVIAEPVASEPVAAEP